jgi:hypothetical protein
LRSHRPERIRIVGSCHGPSLDDLGMRNALPHAASIRSRIAQAASELSASSSEHFLSLLGLVEPVEIGSDGAATWRLAGYYGNAFDNAAIERAVASIHRTYPHMRAH